MCRNLRFLVLSFRGEQNKDRTHWHVAYGDDAHPSVCFLRTVLCSVNFEEPQADKWRISAFNKLERESEPPMKLKHEDAEVNVEGLPQEGRVNIGATFPRWKALKRNKCFQTDAELACFLLDR